MKGKIVGLIVFILIGVGLYQFYLEYPTWSEERDLAAQKSQEELEALANEELVYAGDGYADNILDSAVNFKGIEGNDYYIVKGDKYVNYYLSNIEQMNAIARIEFDEGREDMTGYQIGSNTEAIKVEKSQKLACKAVEDIYTSNYKRLFEDAYYDDAVTRIVRPRTIVNIDSDICWSDSGNGDYVYNKLFGDKMQEFYVNNELMTKAKNAKVIKTYMQVNEESDYAAKSLNMVMECTVDVTTLHAVKSFEGEYCIPKPGETNTINVFVSGNNIVFFDYRFEVCDLLLINE